jgi:hypothetical protein
MIAGCLVAALSFGPTVAANRAPPPVHPVTPFGTCTGTTETRLPAGLITAAIAGKLTQQPTEPDAVYSRRVMPYLRGLSQIRLVLSLPSDRQAYDAETNTYSFATADLLSTLRSLYDDYPDSEPSWVASFVDFREAPVRRYMAQNVYGARFRITRNARASVFYIFRPASGAHDVDPVITFPNPWPRPETAIFRVIIEGDLEPPYVVDDEQRTEATFFHRSDTTAHKVGISILPRCGSIVDLISQKVVARFDPAKIAAITHLQRRQY